MSKRAAAFFTVVIFAAWVLFGFSIGQRWEQEKAKYAIQCPPASEQP